MPNSRLKFALFCLFLVIFALWAGYLIGRSNLWINKLHYNKTANKIEIPEYKPLFTTQSATIQGKITKFDGTNLIVTNSKGISGRIKLAKNL